MASKRKESWLLNEMTTLPTMMLKIVDAKIDADVTVMSSDEFAKNRR